MSRALSHLRGEPFLTGLRAACRPQILCSGLELREEDDQSTIPPVTLRKDLVGFSHILLRPDRVAEGGSVNQRLFPLFDTTLAGLTGCCDYILCSQRERAAELQVLLIELKSGDARGAAAQIDNAGLLIKSFLDAVAWHLHQAPPTLRWRSVVIAGKAPRGNQKRQKLPWQQRAWPLGDDVEHAVLGPTTYSLSFLCGE